MSYVIGALAGILFGGLVGLLKKLFIWKKYEIDATDPNANQAAANSIYARAMISYFVNIVTLFVAFFIRNIVPFHGITFLVATALMLSVMNHMTAVKQKAENK